MTAVKYRSEDVDGLKVFYREAGHADASALLLLHGFLNGNITTNSLVYKLRKRIMGGYGSIFEGERRYP